MTIIVNNKVEALSIAREEMTLGRFVKLFREAFKNGLVRYRIEIA